MTWVVETRRTSEVLPADIVYAKQPHSGTIAWAEDVQPSTVADGIAVRASFPHPVMIRTADCVPLVLMSDEVACVLHVSRKTVLKGLLDIVPDWLAPSKITRVVIGPHICAEHFVFETIREEVAAFLELYPGACTRSAKGLHLSIGTVVDQYLHEWGVPETNVSRDGRCTFETAELPSYRRALRDAKKLSDGIATIVRSTSEV